MEDGCTIFNWALLVQAKVANTSLVKKFDPAHDDVAGL